jgi:hypothetical protein
MVNLFLLLCNIFILPTCLPPDENRFLLNLINFCHHVLDLQALLCGKKETFVIPPNLYTQGVLFSQAFRQYL